MARKRIRTATLGKTLAEFESSNWPLGGTAATTFELQGNLRSTRERLRAECPDTPGVYALLNEELHVVYVGMSISIRKRLQTYFSRQRSRRKESRIRRHSALILWQPIDHELIALLRERELIRKFRPDWNVQGHPTQLKVGYIIAVDQQAESFRIVERIPKSHRGLWGPVPINSRSESAVEQLNFQCGLRDCPQSTLMQFADEPVQLEDAAACLRADLGTCLSPCIGGCSRKQYSTAFQKGIRLLNGKSRKILEEVEREMHRASTARNFEQAARLRDRLSLFRYLDDRLRRFHDWTSQANFVYRIESSIDQSMRWLVVVRGVVHQLLDEPLSQIDAHDADQTIAQALKIVQGRKKADGWTSPGEFESARILFRWFRKHPEQRKQLLTFPQAVRVCRRAAKRAS